MERNFKFFCSVTALGNRQSRSSEPGLILSTLLVKCSRFLDQFYSKKNNKSSSSNSSSTMIGTRRRLSLKDGSSSSLK